MKKKSKLCIFSFYSHLHLIAVMIPRIQFKVFFCASTKCISEIHGIFRVNEAATKLRCIFSHSLDSFLVGRVPVYLSTWKQLNHLLWPTKCFSLKWSLYVRTQVLLLVRVSDPVGYGFVSRGSRLGYVHNLDPSGPAAGVGLTVRTTPTHSIPHVVHKMPWAEKINIRIPALFF